MSESHDKLILLYFDLMLAGEVVSYLLQCLSVFIFVGERMVHSEAEEG